MQALIETQSTIKSSLFNKEKLEHSYKLMNQSSQNPSCTLAYKGIVLRPLSFVFFIHLGLLIWVIQII